MSTISVDRQPIQSLVERKKLQWLREKEELAGLNENSLWESQVSQSLNNKPSIKTHYVRRFQKVSDYLRRDSTNSIASSKTSTSLPPGSPRQTLHKNQSVADTSDEKSDKEMGGETSGYGSDNAHHSPELHPAVRRSTKWLASSTGMAQDVLSNNTPHIAGYESASSSREDRLKWGKSKEVHHHVTDPTPGWLKRGLERDHELLVVNNASPAESPEQDDRPSTCSSSTTNRCFIRGQNAPVDALELAERERRRQVALAHQEDIRQQLMEREKRRDEERLRRAQEEYEEEQRIAREQEVQRQRNAQQEKVRLEKEQRDRQRKEALREAIEIAEKEAKEEKLKQRVFRQNHVNCLEQSFVKMKDEKNFCNKVLKQGEVQHSEEKKDEQKIVAVPTNLSHQQIVAVGDKNDKNEKNSTITSSDSEVSLAQPNYSLTALNQENIELLLQHSMPEKYHNFQFVLIPTTNPLQFSSSQAVQTQNMSLTNTAFSPRTENRILTPTQYRNKKFTCDISTQTDFAESTRVSERMANLEICESRSRREVRERPKWGVNRPPTRYLKQSEKDPQYQRRKLRQKQRQIKSFDEKRYSSDDSQTGSPRLYRKKRGVWRKDEALYTDNVKVYQSELIPLDSDKEHIYFRAKAQHQCCCRCAGSDYDKLPACNNSQMNEEGMLSKLSSIHNDLMLQDNWEEERNQILYSPSRYP